MSAYRNFIDISDLTASEFTGILADAARMKARRGTPAATVDKPLAGKKIAMVFEQPSMRTRMSFDVGIRELGGEPLMITGREIELGERESIADTARVMSRYVDAIMIRMLNHDQLKELATYATVPVINGLTKRSHPCQVAADILTFEERIGPLEGRTVAWTGDSNNVLTSWVHAATKIPFRFRIATPAELAPNPALIAAARGQGADIELTTDPAAAVKGADSVITDCWVSMGDKDEGRRQNLLRRYQVDEALMAKAADKAIFMHCLPATRGEEVTDAVMDGPQSAVFDEAENRLHAQKAVLAWVFGAKVA
ncbi:MAG: ornithine carbamoyltransferase [Proteobacteria bacterium]|nr:ornithine carbamoyltransferase [Pseudomonadota bacterium]